MAVNSVSQVRTEGNIPPQKSFKDKVKNAIDINKDGDVKLESAVVGLATLAIAGIALAKGKHKPLPVQPCPITPTKLTGGNSPVISIPTISPITRPVVTNTAEVLKNNATTQLKEAKTVLLNGGRYRVAKQSATRNLPHKLKAENKAVLSQIEDGLRKQRQERITTSKMAHQISQAASANMHVGNCNITGKTAEGLAQKQEVANMALEQAQSAVQTLENTVGSNQSGKCRKALQQAKNVAAEAQANATRTKQRVESGLREIQANDERKLQQKLQEMANTTPEGRALAQQHQQINSVKQAQNKVKRLNVREASKPANRRAVTDFTRKGFIDKNGKVINKAGLESIVNSAKSSTTEKEMAQAILANA